jgi:hypothetical protein
VNFLVIPNALIAVIFELFKKLFVCIAPNVYDACDKALLLNLVISYVFGFPEIGKSIGSDNFTA